jgi:hypothetical protein
MVGVEKTSLGMSTVRKDVGTTSLGDFERKRTRSGRVYEHTSPGGSKYPVRPGKEVEHAPSARASETS